MNNADVIYRAHVVELRPTPNQVEFLEKCASHSRFVYNRTLSFFSGHPIWHKGVASFLLTKLRQDFSFLNETSCAMQQCAVADLDTAFQHFFRRVKSGAKNPGFPKFKKRFRAKKSFSYRDKRRFDFNERRLRIERLKTKIKTRQKPRFDGVAIECTIFERVGKWFASIVYKLDAPKFIPARQPSVGVDLGIKSFATLSTGEVFANIRPLQRQAKLLAKRQRQLAKKIAGSNRYVKLKKQIAELHYYVSMKRKVIINEITTYLVRNFNTIVIEDLAVRNMMKNRRLAKAIGDVGFGMFRTILTYKAEAAKRKLVVADRFFPSSKTCSNCGIIDDKLTLSHRQFNCNSCGISLDRDLNAAYNLNTLAQGSEESLNAHKSLSPCACVN